MHNQDVSIIVVDDAKFSSAVVSRTLQASGYTDIRIVYNGQDCLTSMIERPATLLLADWLMPEMDGLELANNVRQLDSESSHFTYIMLLTAKENPGALAEAFDRGIDDFINKRDLSNQLIPRVYAASRIAETHNQLLRQNTKLSKQNKDLMDKSTIDRLTGLGNVKYALHRLNSSLKNTEARGGACCLLCIEINDFTLLKKKYKTQILAELLRGIGLRLKQLLRPIDVVVRLSEERFAIITMHDEISDCSLPNFKRLTDAINVKPFQTSNGYLNIQGSISLLAADQQTKMPTAVEMLKLGTSRLKDARAQGGAASLHYHYDDTAIK